MNNQQQDAISHSDLQTFLGQITPFDRLSPTELNSWIGSIKPIRFRMGQKILTDRLSDRVLVIYTGKVRLIGIEASSNRPISLQVLEAGELLGWASLIRNIPCEIALASEETICFLFPGATFTNLIQQYPNLAAGFNIPHRAEVFDLMTRYFKHQNLVLPKGRDLCQLNELVWEDALITDRLPGSLATDRVWFDSKATTGLGIPLVEQPLGFACRLIGLSKDLMTVTFDPDDDRFDDSPPVSGILVEYASDMDFQVTSSEFTAAPSQLAVAYTQGKFPAVLGKGVRDGTLACFQMLSLYLGIKYRRETVQRIIDLQLSRNNQASLELCAAIAEVLGLMGRTIDMPVNQICRIDRAAIIEWEDSYAVIYQVDERQIVLGTPQSGVVKLSFARFVSIFGDPQTGIQVLLLQETKNIQRQKFNLAWFIPYLKPEVKVLVEVLIASFFVQILGLANPLLVQVIIDRVLGQNSSPTLAIFGVLLIIVALFENVLTSIRTIAFANATNRIDLNLAARIIDHLFHLPLSYFDRRAVGELSTRIVLNHHSRRSILGDVYCRDVAL
jgi:hypothetical protein